MTDAKRTASTAGRSRRKAPEPKAELVKAPPAKATISVRLAPRLSAEARAAIERAPHLVVIPEDSADVAAVLVVPAVGGAAPSRPASQRLVRVSGGEAVKAIELKAAE